MKRPNTRAIDSASLDASGLVLARAGTTPNFAALDAALGVPAGGKQGLPRSSGNGAGGGQFLIDTTKEGQ